MKGEDGGRVMKEDVGRMRMIERMDGGQVMNEDVGKMRMIERMDGGQVKSTYRKVLISKKVIVVYKQARDFLKSLALI